MKRLGVPARGIRQSLETLSGDRSARGGGAAGPGRPLGSLTRSHHIADHQLIQRAFTAILNHFVKSGRAPHYAELADILDIDIEEARELQRSAASAAPIAGYWLARDTDFIESWAPFSNVPTHHQIEVDGVPGWYGQ